MVACRLMDTGADSIVRLATEKSAVVECGERAGIISCICAAPFSRTIRTAGEWSRIGTDLVGEPHPSNPGTLITVHTRLTSLEAHTAKRVKDGRWQEGTTPAEFLNDLRAAAGHPAARLHVGVESDRPKAATLTHMGAKGLACSKVVLDLIQTVFVVYDAKHRFIISGYSEPEPIALRLFARWRNRRIIPK